jgi:hypothetical protein
MIIFSQTKQHYSELQKRQIFCQMFWQDVHLTLGRVVEAGDEDVAHHEVDEPDAAGTGT